MSGEMKKDLYDFYSRRSDDLRMEISRLQRKNRLFIITELLTFAGAVAAVVLFCFCGFPAFLLALAALCIAAYILLRRRDVRNGNRTERLKSVVDVYGKECRYLAGDYLPFDDGARYVDPGHSYTLDMDIFGKDSLYNRICRAVTTGGRDRLADCLRHLPVDKSTIDDRRASVDELASDERWRTLFIACGKGEVVDTGALTDMISKIGGMSMNVHLGHPTALIVAMAVWAGFCVSVVLSVVTSLSADVPVVWGIVQLFFVMAVTAKSLRNMNKVVNRLHRQLTSYLGLIRLISDADFKSGELKCLRAKLTDGDGNALESFVRLSDILQRLDRRANVLGLMIFNVLFLSDFFLVRRFLKWQSVYMDKIGEWVDAVSDMDAWVSMATFRYNEPAAGTAEIVEADSVVYESEGLWHPFLGDNAVKNDFVLSDRNYYIITGANMAGKSTFLRAVGINYILALNGMPVFATSLRVSVFSLFTSMRTTDDVTRGISYFNAELLRLEQLIDHCKRSAHTLIILDEILKGTNSLDKLNGSRLFLQEISRLPVTGVIATHDLELSKMEDEIPGRFHNYCFEIKLENRITYSYKITPGVARNQNATFLLKNIIRNI